jgi:hypothetical protein
MWAAAQVIQKVEGATPNSMSDDPKGPPTAIEDLLNAKPAVQWRHVDDALFDDRTFHGITAKLAVFSRCGFKGAIFRNVQFLRCSFTRCYFRKSEFKNVSFLNCTFRDCNFDEASFIETKLDYSEFDNCSVTFAQLRLSMGAHYENIRRELARNLKTNAARRGQNDDARAFLLMELSASEEFNRRKAFPFPDDWYERHYPGNMNRLVGFSQWNWLRFKRVVWGHGEQPLRVLVSSLVVVLAFTLILYIPGLPILNMPNGIAPVDHIGFSAAAFIGTTYGTLTAGNSATRILATIEGVVGLIFFGLLIAAFYRWISQR